MIIFVSDTPKQLQLWDSSFLMIIWSHFAWVFLAVCFPLCPQIACFRVSTKLNERVIKKTFPLLLLCVVYYLVFACSGFAAFSCYWNPILQPAASRVMIMRTQFLIQQSPAPPLLCSNFEDIIWMDLKKKNKSTTLLNGCFQSRPLTRNLALEGPISSTKE